MQDRTERVSDAGRKTVKKNVGLLILSVYVVATALAQDKVDDPVVPTAPVQVCPPCPACPAQLPMSQEQTDAVQKALDAIKAAETAAEKK